MKKNFVSESTVLVKKNFLKKYNLTLPLLKKGQVLVKINFAGICRSQIMEIEGKRGKDKWLPHMLGHEGSGEVVNVGPKVKKVKKKDEVILSWIKGKGLSSSNEIIYKKIKINAGPVTTFNTYSIVSENRVYKKPKNLSKKHAVLFGCAVPTGFGMVINSVKNFKSNTFVVLGVGGVGIFAAIALRSLNAKKIILIDNQKKKLNFLKKLGFKNLLNSKDKKLMYKFNKITRNNGVNFCLESSGTNNGIELGFSLLNSKNGKLIFASHPNSKEKISINPYELIEGKKIEGTWGGKSNLDIDMGKFLSIFNKNLNIIEKLLKVYSFKDLKIAINKSKESIYNRVLLKM